MIRAVQWLILGLLLTMIGCGILLPEDAEKARILDGLGKAVFVSFGLMVLLSLRRKRRPKPAATPVKQAGPSVIVDGSNVMHWGGEPSPMILSRVLKELQNRGLHPLVYFDANVGYKLFDRHVKPGELAQLLDLDPGQITVAPSRTPADEVLLEHATTKGLRVVTNDRFLDWKQKFPKTGEAGFLIKGMWKEGSVILLGLGRASA